MEQDQLNKVWGKEWEEQDASLKELWQHPTFKDYALFKKYIHGETFLDVGAGTGRYGIKVATDFPDMYVVATDTTVESIQLIKKLADWCEVATQLCSVENLPYPDNSFDVVHLGMCLQILPDVPRAIKEMRRVLKPDGVLIVTTVNKYSLHTIGKWLAGREYFEEETAWSRGELRALFGSITLDGCLPEYGIYRLGSYWKPAKAIGKALGRMFKVLDWFTGRFFSRYFGFELIVIAGDIPLGH